MATTLAQPSCAVEPYRLNIGQFRKMLDAGVFPEGVHPELLGGIVVSTTRHEPHNFAVGSLGDWVRPLLPESVHLREEKSARFGQDWMPEPDLAMARGRRSDYRDQLPELRRFVIAIEVADTTYAKDRGIKWVQYAAARIPAYWIVNLPDRRVEVYTAPIGNDGSARYQDSVFHDEAGAVPVAIEGREVGRIAVKDILP